MGFFGSIGRGAGGLFGGNPLIGPFAPGGGIGGGLNVGNMDGIEAALAENAAIGARRSKPGFFGNLGKAAGSFFGGDMASRFARAQALMEGDYGGAARISHGMQESQRESAKAQQEAAMLKPAFEAIDADPNMTPAEKAYAKVNIGEFTKRKLEQFGTYDQSPGSRLAVGQGGGKFATFDGPKQSTETQRLVDYYTSIKRPDLAEAAKAKGALTTETYTNPATGAIEMRAINPASLFPQGPPQAIPQTAPQVLTDEDIRRMRGGAGQSGPQTFP